MNDSKSVSTSIKNRILKFAYNVRKFSNINFPSMILRRKKVFANVENNRLYMNKEALRWPHPDRMVVFQTRYISYNASTHTQTPNTLLYGCYGNQGTLLFIREQWTDIVLARNSKSLDFLMRFMYIKRRV